MTALDDRLKGDEIVVVDALGVIYDARVQSPDGGYGIGTLGHSQLPLDKIPQELQEALADIIERHERDKYGLPTVEHEQREISSTAREHVLDVIRQRLATCTKLYEQYNASGPLAPISGKVHRMRMEDAYAHARRMLEDVQEAIELNT